MNVYNSGPAAKQELSTCSTLCCSVDMMTKLEVILIVLPGEEPVAAINTLRQRFKQAKIVYYCAPAPSGGTFGSEDGVPKALWEDVTILVTLFHVPTRLEDAPKLRLIHLASSGVNHLISTTIYHCPQIVITTSSGCASPQIAEWVMMTALVSNWSYDYLHEKQQQRRWLRTSAGRDAHQVCNLVGQRIGILGYGSIGRQIARVAKALGMDIYAYTAATKTSPEARKDTGYIVPNTGDATGELPSNWYSGTDKKSLHNFLSQQLDMLVICIPSTKETAGLLGQDELDVFCGTGRRPFLSNISRGTAIDQNALIEALQTEKLRGAALDVSDPEPLPADHPLWDAPNVIIHPHISAGGVTDIYISRVFEVLSLNIDKLYDGGKLLNEVNREMGY